MSRIPQSFINTLVLLMAGGWLILAIVYVLPTGGGYYDGLPDEVELLDEDIKVIMESVPLVTDLVPTERFSADEPVSLQRTNNGTVLSGSEIFAQTKHGVVYINQFIFDTTVMNGL